MKKKKETKKKKGKMPTVIGSRCDNTLQLGATYLEMCIKFQT